MKVCDVETVRGADASACREYGISGLILMENAAIACVKELESFNSFTVLCGKGNNAGDGFAIARHLLNRGKDVKVYTLLGTDFKGDAKVNYDILQKMQAEHGDDLRSDIKMSDCVVDAIFGTGIHGEISGEIREIIDAVNSDARYVLSVDVPSGIDADSGKICGSAVKADKTVTFACYKKGLLLYPAADYTGETVVADISIPKQIFEGVKTEVTDEEKIRKIMPKRQKNSHKGDYGKVLIIGGSVGMAGAVCLAARGAFRVGAGMVTACVPKEINDIVQKTVVEAMTISVDFESDRRKIIERLPSFDVILFGNGIGREAFVADLLEDVLKNSAVPVVIDADGLFALSKKPELLELCENRVILTPHTMEMARLSGVAPETVEDGRFEISKSFASKNRLTLVLKGNHTIITAQNGEQAVNMTGNSGMATAGSGDVLAGMTAGLVPQVKDLFGAAILSVYLHGKAGDFVAGRMGEMPVCASDIADAISHILPVEI